MMNMGFKMNAAPQKISELKSPATVLWIEGT